MALAIPVDRNIAAYDDEKRAIAKLMAVENITVQFIDGQPTASFDTVGRVLTLPNWPFLHVDQLDTQIGHEIGHARYTDHAYYEHYARSVKAYKEKKKALGRNLNAAEMQEIFKVGIFTYINIIEDVRIERKVREAFAGMKAVFYNGRKAFAEKGPIFQVDNPRYDKTGAPLATRVIIDGKKTEVAELDFIDRINLFFKIGAFVQVPFSTEERSWLPVIQGAHSTENAVEIAEKIYAMQQHEQQQPQQGGQGQPQKGKGPKGAGQPGMPSQGDEGDEDGEKSKGKGKGGKKGDDDESDSKDDTDGKSADHKKPGEGDEDESGADSSSSGGDDEGEDNAEDGESDSESADDGDDEGDGSDSDSDSNSKSESKSKKNASNKQGTGSQDGPELTAKTDEAFNRALQKLVEQAAHSPAASIKHLLIKPLEESTVRERTVTASEWVKQCEQRFAGNATRVESALRRSEEEWNGEFLQTARHMAAEFQRRKTAKQLQKARIARTGRLDMNRLHSYRFADDLFKRVMTVPNGQSHGIVMIVDGSSSMESVFASVLDQVLLFAHFCFSCNIPFEAYLFTDRSGRSHSQNSLGPNTVTAVASGSLVGLVNTVTDRPGFKRQVRCVLAMRAQFTGSNNTGVNIPYSSLGGTPLYSGMMIMERHVERLKRTRKLDKVMGVVVTDGGDTAGLVYDSPTMNYDGTVRSSWAHLAHTAFVVRDTVTRKNFTFIEKSGGGYVAPNNAVITMLFDVMRARHDCRNVYLYLVDGYSDADTAATLMLRAGARATKSSNERQAALRRDHSFLLEPGAADCCIMIEPSIVKLAESDFEKLNTKGMSAEKIGERFVSAVKKAQANRPFVNAVMPYLA